MLTSCVKEPPCQILDLDQSLAPDCTLEIENMVSGQTFVLKNKADIKEIIHFVDMQWCAAQAYTYEWVWDLPENMLEPPLDGFVFLALKDKDYSMSGVSPYASIWSANISPQTDPYGLYMTRSIMGRGKDNSETKEVKLLLNQDAWKLYSLLLKIVRKYDNEFTIPEPRKDKYINRSVIRRSSSLFQQQSHHACDKQNQ